MVSCWTWIHKFKRIFILASNYNGLVVHMYRLYRVHVRLRVCIQRGVFVMFFGYLLNRFRSRTRMQNVSSNALRSVKRASVYLHFVHFSKESYCFSGPTSGPFVLRVILATNYIVFLVDMDYFVQRNLHFAYVYENGADS